MPRVAIEKLKLLEKKDLLDLVGKNLEAIRCYLLETSYREEISKIPKEEANSTSMEEALLENFARTLNTLIRFSVGDIKNLLSTIMCKFETINIKTLIRATKTKTSMDEAVSNIVPVGNLTKDLCRDILSHSPTIEGILGSLSDSKCGFIVREALVRYKEAGDLMPIELALDKAAYQGIFDSIEKLKGLDKLIARNILGIEADTINIKTILRGKARGVPKDRIKEYFLPSFLVDEQVLEKAIETTDVKALAEYLIKAAETKENLFYQKFFLQILEHCDSLLSKLESILERASLGMSLYMQKKHLKYYNISYVLAFLNLKWFEIRNLRCIIVGSERKISPTQVKRFLIF
jgi:V/A-type H+-transporting ATPase subunit C